MENMQKALELHFAINKVVESYGGLDKVISFDWNNGDWKVVVQAVKKDGSIDSRYPRPRTHATMPSHLS